jgi:membrane protease YdiL (CAAX protease family)
LFIARDEQRLRTLWRLFILFVLYFICNFLFGILLFGVLHRPFSIYWGELATFAGTFVSVYISRRYLDRRTFKSLGWAGSLQVPIDLIAGMFISGIMMGCIYSCEVWMGWLTFSGFVWTSTQGGQVIGGILAMFVMFSIVAFQEELLFRGYILQNIADGLNLFWAIFLSSLIFALMHFSNPSFSWMALIGLCLSGLFIAYSYVVTRQLWLPVGIHLGWNFFEGSVFGFQVSGLEGMPRLIEQAVHGPIMLTGGSFGPEAGFVLIPALFIGFILIFLYSRLISAR